MHLYKFSVSIPCFLSPWQLQRASRLLKAEHQKLVHELYIRPAHDHPHTPHTISTIHQVNSIVQERHSKVSFNVSWLEDLYEETVVELLGERVTPLVTNPGRIMLTSSRIYFQPYNNVEVVRLKYSVLYPFACP